MNYNQLASDNPKIVCICHTMAADMQNKLHRHPMNGNKSRTRPAPMRTKGRATVQTTTRATAASPDTRRRYGPYIAPTAAPT